MINMNIYVGNISYNVCEGELIWAFRSFGQVESVKIIRDKYSGQSKGFGFIEMPSTKEARSAITDLNGKEQKGMMETVKAARGKTN